MIEGKTLSTGEEDFLNCTLIVKTSTHMVDGIAMRQGIIMYKFTVRFTSRISNINNIIFDTVMGSHQLQQTD